MKHSRTELLLAALTTCLALASCKDERNSESTPDVSDPLPPWPVRGRPQVRGMDVLQDGTVLVYVWVAV